MYPLSNFAETINEVETGVRHSGSIEPPGQKGDQELGIQGNAINVKRGYDVHSEQRV